MTMDTPNPTAGPARSRVRLVVLSVNVVLCAVCAVVVARSGGASTPAPASVSTAVGSPSGQSATSRGALTPVESRSPAAQVDVPRWPAGTVLVTDTAGGLTAIDPATFAPHRVALPTGYAVIAVPGAQTPYAGAVLVAQQAQGTVSWLTAKGELGNEIQVGGAPTGAVFGPTGSRDAGTFLVLDSSTDVATPVAADGTVGVAVKVGSNPIAGVPLAGGGFAVLAEGNGRVDHGQVSFIDLSKAVHSFDVDVGVSPIGIAAGGPAGTLYVADNGDPLLHVLSTNGQASVIHGFGAPTQVVAAAGPAGNPAVYVADGRRLRSVGSDGRIADLATASDDVSDVAVAPASAGSAVYFDLANDPGLWRIGTNGEAGQVAGVDFRVNSIAAGLRDTFAADLAGSNVTAINPAGQVAAKIAVPENPLLLLVIAQHG